MSSSCYISISSKVAREDGAGVVLCVKARDRTGATGDPAIPAFTINVQDIDLVIIVMILIILILIFMGMRILFDWLNGNNLYPQCLEGEWHVEQPCLSLETL